jgi:hypothetical protein
MASESVTSLPARAHGKESGRTLLLVAGSGRSGTSLFAGILQRLGYLVPQPEVPADATNPKGFAESQWVVDFHTKLLRRAKVQTSDARPAAWSLTADICLDDEVRQELSTWLAGQFAKSDDIVIKDPRLSWFLALWRQCAEEMGASIRFVTMLRHPGAVVDSKQKWYGGRQGEIARAAGWVNQLLFTERATRDAPRAFVHYEALLEDWTQAVGRAGETLDLTVVRNAPANRMRDVHAFVDRGLSRSRPGWGDVEIPERLRTQADEIWSVLSALAEGEAPDAAERLDTLRADYIAGYEEAEAMVQSSIVAAQRTSGGRKRAEQSRPPAGVRLARRVPKRYRHAVPLRWRARIARAMQSMR